MEEIAAPPEEKELPAPDEKLLRAPTFGEKYGKFKWPALLIVLILIIGGVYVASNTQEPAAIPPLKPTVIPQVTIPDIPTLTSQPSPGHTVPADWKTYTNTNYGYEVKYPPTLEIIKYGPEPERKVLEKKTYELKPISANKLPVETTNSIDFDIPSHPYAGSVPYYITVVDYPSANSSKNYPVTNGLSQAALDKIFALQIGDEIDKNTTYEIGGKWNQKTNYKRLPDIHSNSLDFFVIENLEGYKGTHRVVLLKKDGKVFITGLTYTVQKELKDFDIFLSSFKFIGPSTVISPAATCGGFAGKNCPTGYSCQLESQELDASGICVPNLSPSQNPKQEGMCTMDAKICPDGSYVGRQPPKCEFAPCPK